MKHIAACGAAGAILRHYGKRQPPQITEVAADPILYPSSTMEHDTAQFRHHRYGFVTAILQPPASTSSSAWTPTCRPLLHLQHRRLRLMPRRPPARSAAQTDITQTPFTEIRLSPVAAMPAPHFACLASLHRTSRHSPVDRRPLLVIEHTKSRFVRSQCNPSFHLCVDLEDFGLLDINGLSIVGSTPALLALRDVPGISTENTASRSSAQSQRSETG